MNADKVDVLELDDARAPEPITAAPDERRRRRWNSDHYPKSLVVRVTDDEHEEITRRAGLSRAPSVSRYMAVCALNGRAPELRQTPPPTAEERERLERLLYELRKLGTNLNQLTHAANLATATGGASPAPSDLAEAARAVKTIVEQLRERL